MKNIHWGKLILSILLALGAGYLGNLLGGSTAAFQTLVKPSFAPPAILFPIVWSILYLLMGISSYLIWTSSSKRSPFALSIYIVQLIVNVLWPLLFFRLGLLTFSFVWLLLLILLVILMIWQFSKIKTSAAWLQLPYLLWLLFAGVLNLSIAILN